MSPLLRDDVPLSGRRVLVVEDEYFLADEVGRELRALGADIAGPAADIDDAYRLLNDGGILDGAVLDVNLREVMVFPIARELRARNVPFVFTSGYDAIVVGKEFQAVPLWEKPFNVRAMVHRLTDMILQS
ncbi:response regulator [Bradyrhizobium jicamae]|uniref:Response regulator n=1 Tax=Bradyrhizobium jicamae TaxID=280332 RepID=A0ABS5FQ33_9BRAD|nr:response regulator [Bradyrhizobium jicamae]MBR0798918.1 response regulator [Bradyrhizobium jicamae]MBR0938617.1 response regulator [Bradyrhizobium jicamae]